MKKEERPLVGLGIIIRNDGKVLLGKRKGSHGEGTWSFPGGHLEKFETLEICGLRENSEETGLEIEVIDKNYSPITTNDFFAKENKHYVTLYIRANYLSGEPKVKEPEKCEEWKWFEWENLPNNLFIPVKNLIKTGYNPFK